MMNTDCRPQWTAKTILLLVVVAAFLSACAQFPRPGQSGDEAAQQPPPEAPQAEPEMLYQWDGDGRRISRIHIDADAQKAVFYDGADQIGWSRVATGINHFATPKGRFTITEKVADKRSNLYGWIYDDRGKLKSVNAKRGIHRIPPGGRFLGAEMPYFMRLTKGGVGIHGGPIPKPGVPASHGCIRLPEDVAPIVFNHVRVGTPVRITGS